MEIVQLIWRNSPGHHGDGSNILVIGYLMGDQLIGFPQMEIIFSHYEIRFKNHKFHHHGVIASNGILGDHPAAEIHLLGGDKGGGVLLQLLNKKVMVTSANKILLIVFSFKFINTFRFNAKSKSYPDCAIFTSFTVRSKSSLYP